MSRQVQIKKQGTRQSPAPGTPGNPITTTPSGKPMPY